MIGKNIVHWVVDFSSFRCINLVLQTIYGYFHYNIPIRRLLYIYSNIKLIITDCIFEYSTDTRSSVKIGRIRSISSYLLQARQNVDQNNSEYGHFSRSV